MENIIKGVMTEIAHGKPRTEAINDAANIHAASYGAYCVLYSLLESVIPT